MLKRLLKKLQLSIKFREWPWNIPKGTLFLSFKKLTGDDVKRTYELIRNGKLNE